MKRLKRFKRQVAMVMAMATFFTVGFTPVNVSYASEAVLDESTTETTSETEVFDDILSEETSETTPSTEEICESVSEESTEEDTSMIENDESMTEESTTEETSEVTEDATTEDVTTEEIEVLDEDDEVIYGELPVGFNWLYEADETYFQEDLHMSKQEYVDFICGTNYAEQKRARAAKTKASTNGNNENQGNSEDSEDGSDDADPDPMEPEISIVPNEVVLLQSPGALNSIKWSDVKWWMEAKALGTSYGTNGYTSAYEPSAYYGWSCAGFVSSVIYQFYDSDISDMSNTAAVSNVDSFCSSSSRFSYIGGYSVGTSTAYYDLCKNGTIKAGDVLVFTRNGNYKHAAIAGDQAPTGIDKIDGIYYMYHALNSTVGTIVTTGGYYLSGASDKTGNYVKVYRVKEDIKGSVTLSKVVDDTDTYSKYDYSYVGCQYTIYNADNSAVGVFTIESDGKGKVTSSSYSGKDTYTLSNLPAGTYTVSETKINDGFTSGGIMVNGTSTTSFTISANNKTITIVGTNNLVEDGTLKLTKDVSGKETEFDLTGATYKVYHVEGDKEVHIGTFVMDKDGVGHVIYNVHNAGSDKAGVGDYNNTKMTKLPYGEYKVKEITGPDSGLFVVNTTPLTFKVTPSEKDFVLKDSETFSPYKVKIKKTSTNTVVSANNNCYSLKGATYTIYTDSACTKVAKAYKNDGTTYNAELVCDENGDTATLKMKKGTYYVKETKAGKGYALDTKVHTITLTDAHRTTPYELKVSDKPQMDPVYILLQKKDADEPNKYYIEGATFEVKFYAGEYGEGVNPATLGQTPTRSWLFKSGVNGDVVFSDNSDYFISGDEFYRNSAGIIMLPLGTVTIQEKSTPVEYILDDTVYVRKITADGTVEAVTTYNEPTIPNKPKRQAFQIMKFGETDTSELNPLANAGFMAANVEDLKMDADGNYIWDESKAINLCDINNTPDNFDDDVKELFTDKNGYALSAKLRYGTYLVHETTVPKNYIAIKDFTVTVNKDDEVPQEIRYFTDEIIKSYLRVVKLDGDTKLPLLTCNGNVKFKIYSYDKKEYVSFKYFNGSKFVTMDKFTINNEGYVMTPGTLIAGNYRLEEYSTMENYYSKKANAKYDFVIDENTVFETFVDEEGNEQDAVVFTMNIENQPYHGNLNIHKIGEFYELEDGEYVKKDVSMSGITFEVRAAEDIYSTDGQHVLLYSKDEVVTTITTDKNGNASTGDILPLGKYYLTETNTPDDYEKCDDVMFEISTSKEIKTVNKNDGTQVKYINVEADIINYKKIELHTTATDKNTGLQSALAGADATIIDEVFCKNLLVGHTYKVSGKLYDVATGEPIIVDGKEVVAEKEFEATAGVMTIELEYTLDATTLIGKKTVVFEDLYEGDRLVATHSDLTDKNQQIDFPELKTHFLDRESDDHDGNSVDEVVLVDHVKFTGLVPGKTYQLSAVLMDQETGKPIVNGKFPVMSFLEFTAEESEGEVEVQFTVDGKSLIGKTTVCFESLAYDKKMLAIHADINDKDQTVYFPEIQTEAKGKKYLGHVEMLAKEITIIDTVTYHNLNPEKSYTVYGQIYDANTGEPLLDDDGNEIKQMVIFTPDAKDGSVDVEFTFKSLKLADTTTVVFEDLYETETARKVASHADVNDEGQQVYIDYTKLEISKQDATTSSEVEGAKLSLYDAYGKLVESWISGPDKHVINELLPGQYRLVEETAPNGYIVSEEVTFTLEDTGELQKVVMYDEEVTGKLHVLKIDDYSKKNLPGVKFMLFKKSDSVIMTGIDQYLIDQWETMDESDKNIINAHKVNADDLYVGTYVTDENGEFTTDKLMYGEYYIVETEAKDGYFLAKDPCEFKIDTPDQEVDMTIENEGKEGRIDINPNPGKPGNGDGHHPKTGDATPIKAIAGLMLAAGAVFLFLRKRMKLAEMDDVKIYEMSSDKKVSKKTGKKLMSLALAGAIGLGVASTPAYAAEPGSTDEDKTYLETKTATYDTDDESAYDFEFEDEIEVDGVKYKLDAIMYDKEAKYSMKDGVELTVTKIYEDVDKDYEPQRVITYEGIEYEINTYEVKISDDSELHLFYYDETDYVTVAPEHKENVEYTYHDEESEKDYTVTLPYSRTEAVASDYAIPVSFKGTVTGYDAAYIVIGEYKIENPGEVLDLDQNLISTILETINVNPADYTNVTIGYVGEPYTNDNGELCRDYEISGNSFGTKYRVYYEDDVKGITTSYECEAVYILSEEVQAQFQTVSYDVTANATYKVASEKEAEKKFLETTVGKAVLAGSIILGLMTFIALGIYVLKGGRRDTDYRSRRDSKRDYKKLKK